MFKYFGINLKRPSFFFTFFFDLITLNSKPKEASNLIYNLILNPSFCRSYLGPARIFRPRMCGQTGGYPAATVCSFEPPPSSFAARRSKMPSHPEPSSMASCGQHHFHCHVAVAANSRRMGASVRFCVALWQVASAVGYLISHLWYLISDICALPSLIRPVGPVRKVRKAQKVRKVRQLWA